MVTIREIYNQCEVECYSKKNISVLFPYFKLTEMMYSVLTANEFQGRFNITVSWCSTKIRIYNYPSSVLLYLMLNKAFVGIRPFQCRHLPSYNTRHKIYEKRSFLT